MTNEFAGSLGVLIVGVFLILIAYKRIKTEDAELEFPAEDADSDLKILIKRLDHLLDRIESNVRWTKWISIAWLRRQLREHRCLN